jgi:hypothetical protein
LVIFAKTPKILKILKNPKNSQKYLKILKILKNPKNLKNPRDSVNNPDYSKPATCKKILAMIKPSIREHID